MDADTHRGTFPTTNVEVKLREMTTIDFNNHNWSWLLNPNRPHVLPVVPRVYASSNGQLVPKPEGFVQEKGNPDSET